MSDVSRDDSLAVVKNVCGILPIKKDAPPSELLVRHIRGDSEPLIEWYKDQLRQLRADAEDIEQLGAQP